MPKETGIYRGKVKTFIKNGNTVVRKETHNAGLQDMALLFAKAASGNIDYNTDVPRLIDIGYEVPATEQSAKSGVWQSLLNSPINIGGRQYKYDTTLNNWVAELTSTLYYSDVNGGIVDLVLNELSKEDSEISLKIKLCSYVEKERKYFAVVDIDDPENFIRNLRQGTSAIIMWYLELLYDSENLLNDGTVEPNIDSN